MVQARSTTFVGCQQDSKTLILPHHDVHYLWLSTAQGERPAMPAHERNRYHALPLAVPLGLCFCRWMWCCFVLYKVGTIIMTVAINAVPAEPCTSTPWRSWLHALQGE